GAADAVVAGLPYPAIARRERRGGAERGDGALQVTTFERALRLLDALRRLLGTRIGLDASLVRLEGVRRAPRVRGIARGGGVRARELAGELLAPAVQIVG